MINILYIKKKNNARQVYKKMIEVTNTRRDYYCTMSIFVGSVCRFTIERIIHIYYKNTRLYISRAKFKYNEELPAKDLLSTRKFVCSTSAYIHISLELKSTPDNMFWRVNSRDYHRQVPPRVETIVKILVRVDNLLWPYIRRHTCNSIYIIQEQQRKLRENRSYIYTMIYKL